MQQHKGKHQGRVRGWSGDDRGMPWGMVGEWSGNTLGDTLGDNPSPPLPFIGGVFWALRRLPLGLAGGSPAARWRLAGGRGGGSLAGGGGSPTATHRVTGDKGGRLSTHSCRGVRGARICSDWPIWPVVTRLWWSGCLPMGGR